MFDKISKYTRNKWTLRVAILICACTAANHVVNGEYTFAAMMILLLFTHVATLTEVKKENEK